MMDSLSLSLSRGILGKGYNVPVRLFEEGLRVIRVVAEMCCVRGEGEGEGGMEGGRRRNVSRSRPMTSGKAKKKKKEREREKGEG